MDVGFSLMLFLGAFYLTFKYTYVDVPTTPEKYKRVSSSLQILLILSILGWSIYEGRSNTGWALFVGFCMIASLWLAYLKETGHPFINRLRNLFTPIQLVFHQFVFIIVFSLVLFVYYYF